MALEWLKRELPCEKCKNEPAFKVTSHDLAIPYSIKKEQLHSENVFRFDSDTLYMYKYIFFFLNSTIKKIANQTIIYRLCWRVNAVEHQLLLRLFILLLLVVVVVVLLCWLCWYLVVKIHEIVSHSTPSPYEP